MRESAFGTNINFAEHDRSRFGIAIVGIILGIERKLYFERGKTQYVGNGVRAARFRVCRAHALRVDEAYLDFYAVRVYTETA